MISPTERNTTRTPCPGDCAAPFALRDGEPSCAPSRMRLQDCSARTCRMPACTEPEERLTESANGSVASWRCFEPGQDSRGSYPDDSNLTERGNRVSVPALEPPAAVALLGLEGEMATAAEGLKSSGLWQPGGSWSNGDGHPSGGLQDTGDRQSTIYPGRLAEAHAAVPLPLARARASVAGCGGPVQSERRRAMAGDNPRPPRRP